MRVVIVYESMYGNTHEIADHVAKGMTEDDVVVTSVHGADEALLDGADLLVVGGPTHVHGLTSKRSREAAAEAAARDDDLEMDPDAEGPGLRDWFHELPRRVTGRAAAFDTRIDASPALTGRASKGIARRLARHGYDLVVEPESFLVDKESRLLDGEAERAERWGAALSVAASSA